MEPAANTAPKQYPEDCLVIKSPQGENCENNDGIPWGLFLVSRGEWDRLKNDLQASSDTISEVEYTNGGHGCILQDDLLKMMENSKISRVNPSDDIRDFVRSSGNDDFLDRLREWRIEYESTGYVITQSARGKYRADKDPLRAFRSIEAANAARKASGYEGEIHRINFTPDDQPT